MKLTSIFFFTTCVLYGQNNSYVRGVDIIKNKTNHNVYIVEELEVHEAKKLHFYCKAFEIDTSKFEKINRDKVYGDTIVIKPNTTLKKNWSYMCVKDSLVRDLDLYASKATLNIFTDQKHYISVPSSKYLKKGRFRLTITKKMLDLQ